MTATSTPSAIPAADPALSPEDAVAAAVEEDCEEVAMGAEDVERLSAGSEG